MREILCHATPQRLELADAAHTLAERATRQTEASPKPGVESGHYELVYRGVPPGQDAVENAAESYSLQPREQ